MKFIVKNRFLVYLMAVALGITSCGSDDNGDDGGNGNGGGSNTTSPLTPDQHKAKLETIGKDFIAMFNPNDHKAAVESIDYLSEIIDAPGLFDNEDDSYPMIPDVLSSVRSVILHNDMNGLATFASEPDTYTLSEYAGVYTYSQSKRIWEKTAATGKIELKYNNGKANVMILAFEGGTDYTQAEGVVVNVPAKVNLSMKVADVEQISCVATTSLSADQKSAEVAVKLSLIGGYVWDLSLNAKGTEVSETYKMSKNGQQLMASIAKLTGNKLTSPDDIENGEASDMLANGEFDFRIMDVALNGKGDIKAIIDGVDKIDEKQTDEQKTKQEADIYNQYAKIELYYADKAEKIADVKMRAFYDGESRGNYYNPQTGKIEYGEFKNYELMPNLIFVSDGSEFSLDTYFSEANFGSLIQSVETLINKYADIIDADHVDL